MSIYYCPSCEQWQDPDWVFPVEDDGEVVACNDCYDPTPWCHVCGAMTKQDCGCDPRADND